MSPQDQVERVLKDIHVFFSKCDRCTDDPGMLKVDQKKFVDLLERLNYGIYDLMDRYEQTQISAGETQRAARKQGDQIIEQAQKKADDVYAASLLFTSDAITGIREVMERMQDSMNDMMRQVKKELFFQREELQKNESELRSQLTDLADTQTYLMLLDEISHERAMGKRDLLREREIGRAFARNLSGAGRDGADQYYKKSGAMPQEEDILDLDEVMDAKKTTIHHEAPSSAAGESVSEKREEPEIIINRDAAYFKWKESQEQAAAEETPDFPEAEKEEVHTGPSAQTTKEINLDSMRPIRVPDDRKQAAEQIGSEAAEPAFDFTKEESQDWEMPVPESLSEDERPLDEIAQSGKDLPNEEDLLKAVLRDEMELYGSDNLDIHLKETPPEPVREEYIQEAPRRHSSGMGGRLKDFLLGKDLVDDEE